MERALTPRKPDIVIIGAGNVATHLALNLARVTRIRQIYNRHIDSATRLAGKVGAYPVDSLTALVKDADLYIVAVKDDAIQEIARQLEGFGGVWAHTSGSVDMKALSAISPTHGVVYPMQTFSKDVDVAMQEVPFFIEATDATTRQLLTDTAGLISENVHEADSTQRAMLHVAAVFACNFTNRLWDISDSLLHRLGLDFSTMGPLVKAMLDKALKVSPHEGQTGPARRNDRQIIEKHLGLLSGDTRKLYEILSNSIINRYHTDSDEQDKL